MTKFSLVGVVDVVPTNIAHFLFIFRYHYASRRFETVENLDSGSDADGRDSKRGDSPQRRPGRRPKRNSIANRGGVEFPHRTHIVEPSMGLEMKERYVYYSHIVHESRFRHPHGVPPTHPPTHMDLSQETSFPPVCSSSLSSPGLRVMSVGPVMTLRVNKIVRTWRSLVVAPLIGPRSV